MGRTKAERLRMHEMIEKLLRDYPELTLTEIAQRLGVNTKSVRRIRDKLRKDDAWEST